MSAARQRTPLLRCVALRQASLLGAMLENGLRFQMSLLRRRACNETKKKAPVRSQSVSLERERWTSHCRLSEGSKCLQAGRLCGVRFLHSERQGQVDRRLRAGEGSRGCSSGYRRFLWGRVLNRTAAAF